MNKRAFLFFLLFVFLNAAWVLGQEMHRIHTSGLPLGEVGQTRLAVGGPVRGYYQPVLFSGPEGCELSLACESRFTPPRPMSCKAGLLIGQVYRMRLTNIPLHAGEAVYPTIEVVDRTYPPRHRELDFPIVAEITFEDIELALAGKFVTKVIYLENPQTSLPTRTEAERPLRMDITPGNDPLHVAGEMGRPVAIVRLGGRVPAGSGPIDPGFFFGCAPWIGVDQIGRAHV